VAEKQDEKGKVLVKENSNEEKDQDRRQQWGEKLASKQGRRKIEKNATKNWRKDLCQKLRHEAKRNNQLEGCPMTGEVELGEAR